MRVENYLGDDTINNKEIGGFLPLELEKRKEYYYKNCISLNSARYCILYALKCMNIENIIIPYYLCNTVYETLKKNNITIQKYHIDKNFSIILDEKEKHDLSNNKAALLVVNYFGMLDNNYLKKIVGNYKNVIVDNTQAFFSKPIDNYYSVYSCRKFFGVSDGAYIVKKGIQPNFDILDSFSSDNSAFLLKSLEHGTNYCYNEYLDYESEICSAGLRKMSKLTSSILSQINYCKTRKIRKENFNYLSKRLSKYNELKNIKHVSPMIYPLLIKNDRLRKILIDNKIYISQWWKQCYDDVESNDFEKHLSKYLFPLPIDQRYTIEDMNKICEIIERSI